MPHEGFLPHTSHTEAMVPLRSRSLIEASAVDVHELGAPTASSDRRPLRATRPLRTDPALQIARCRRSTRPLERSASTRCGTTVTTFRDTAGAPTRRINRLNVYPVPDGDTGTNMARTLDAVVAEMDERVRRRARPDVRRDQPRLADGRPGQQRGDPVADPARHRRRRSRARSRRRRLAWPMRCRRRPTAAYKAVLKPVEGTILTVVRESADGRRAGVGRGARRWPTCCAPPATPGATALARDARPAARC